MMPDMKQIDHSSAVDVPVGSAGGRSPSSLSTGLAPPAPPAAPTSVPTPRVGPLAPGQRWSVARKREVVLRLLRGESMELLSRELGVPIFKLEQWRQKADAALDGALKEREADTASTELAAAMQRIGELSMENELLRAKMERPGPLVRRRSR
jgi:transposase